MYLRGKWLLPISRPPIKDGWIEIEEGVIVRIGQGEAPGKAEEYGILLPGLVNAHCHLELTLLPGENLKKGSFTGWVREVLKARREMVQTDYAHAVREGIGKLLLSGVTTVADHTSGYGSIGPLLESPMRCHIFGEVVGRELNFARQTFEAAGRLVERVERSSLTSRVRASRTPHAPHSVHPQVLEEIFATNHAALFSIHVAESRDEDRLYKTGRGPMADLIKERDPLAEAGNIVSLRRSAIRTLAVKRFLSEKVMAVHCNYIDDEDIAILKEFAISVVHCPGSHKFFGHRKFRLESLTAAGINVAVGTDSHASNDGINMLEEISCLAESYPALQPADILRMATLGGAKALQWDREIGTLEAGKRADIIGIPCDGEERQPEAAVLKARSIVLSVIDGRRVI